MSRLNNPYISTSMPCVSVFSPVIFLEPTNCKRFNVCLSDCTVILWIFGLSRLNWLLTPIGLPFDKYNIRWYMTRCGLIVRSICDKFLESEHGQYVWHSCYWQYTITLPAIFIYLIYSVLDVAFLESIKLFIFMLCISKMVLVRTDAANQKHHL